MTTEQNRTEGTFDGYTRGLGKWAADAAFVVRPHTAAGTAKAAADATALAAMLQSYDSVDEALWAWERARIAAGMSLAEYGVPLGDHTARAR